ncbi:MAG: methylenetetrahydrofolate reductase [NAD(P)H] [Armatimonadetes bacterium]|nr:methylenetetrahydrofolate reductase [NAD(P)H] [Armatimonadota bacterium]
MRVSEVYGQDAPAFSFEFFPPRTPKGLQRLYEAIDHLAELNPAFVSVTYGAGGSTRAGTVETARHIRRNTGLEPVAHLTCLGQTRSDVCQILDELKGEGVENVLALRGDVKTGESAPQGEFAYANELVGFVRGNNGFCIGAACYPEGHVENPDPVDDMRRLVAKVDAGVDFLITQLFFDNDKYFSFVERARAGGIQVPIVPGLMPVTNVAQVERFTKMCGASIPPQLAKKLERAKDDDQAVLATGIEWALDQGRELLANGAPGIHFYTLNKSWATRIVCRGLLRW